MVGISLKSSFSPPRLRTLLFLAVSACLRGPNASPKLCFAAKPKLCNSNQATKLFACRAKKDSSATARNQQRQAALHPKAEETHSLCSSVRLP